MLYAGTAAGVYSATIGPPKARLVGLGGQLVTHIAVSKGAVLAAVPVRGPVHEMTEHTAAGEAAQPGLHIAAPPAEPAAQAAGPLKWRRVWEGDARSCAVDAAGGALFVGERTAQAEALTARCPWESSTRYPAPWPHRTHSLCGLAPAALTVSPRRPRLADHARQCASPCRRGAGRRAAQQRRGRVLERQRRVFSAAQPGLLELPGAAPPAPRAEHRVLPGPHRQVAAVHYAECAECAPPFHFLECGWRMPAQHNLRCRAPCQCRGC